MNAGQHRLRQVHGELRGGALQVSLEDLGHARARVGVVVLARQENQARVEAPVDVAPDEDAHLAAIAEAQYAERRLQQRVLVDLEELVPRVLLQHGEEVLVHVAVRPEAGALHHARDALAQQRHLARVGVVSRGRIEPDETALADHLAGGVEALHADVVEVAGPMDGRARIRAADG